MRDSSERELRSVERFCLKLPVNLKWRLRGDEWLHSSGVTRDISSRGMYVQALAHPPVGAPLEFEISLVPGEAAAEIRIEGHGRVLRVERTVPKSGMKGFAVENLWFKVREP